MDINKDLTIIMYHYVRDLKNSKFPTIKGLDVSLFKEQISYLQKHYNFVTVNQVISAFDNQEKLPSKAVLLTFDDAYIDHFINVFPILENNKIQGAFYPPVKAIKENIVLDVNKIHFILASTSTEKTPSLLNKIKLLLDKYRNNYQLSSFEAYFEKLAIPNRFDCKEIIFIKRLLQTELDERLRTIMLNELFSEIIGIDESVFSKELYMSINQLKCMVDCGMHVGSHGYDHYWLGALSSEKQKIEIEKSIEFIKEIGGDINNWTMCYPYGNNNDDTIALLKKYGCKLAFTTTVDLVSTASKPDAVYQLPRLDTNDIPKDADADVNDWYYKAK